MGWYPFGIGKNDVINVLTEIVLDEDDLQDEKNVEEILADELREEFSVKRVHQQYNLEGYWQHRIDIDINNDIGVEIKLASSLTSVSEVHRLIGQATYYKHRKYGSDLIIAIAGFESERETPIMKELEGLIEDMGVEYIYISEADVD